MKQCDLTGQTFNYLTVIEPSDKGKHSKMRLWKCRCVCGNTTYASFSKLVSGEKKSCGCIRKRRSSSRTRRARSFAPFEDCVSYNPNINKGCIALKERLCEKKGKCSFYKPKEERRETS